MVEAVLAAFVGAAVSALINVCRHTIPNYFQTIVNKTQCNSERINRPIYTRRELTGTRKTSHEHKNKDVNRPRYLSHWHARKYKVHETVFYI